MSGRLFQLLAGCVLAICLLHAGTAHATKRALLISLSDYATLRKLDNPPIDVKMIGDKLKEVGFQISTIDDSQGARDRFLVGLEAFVASIQQGDEVFVYYSGHGVQLDSGNMMVPLDAPEPVTVRPSLLAEKLVSMQRFIDAVNDQMPAIQVWVIDACRTNPYSAPTRSFAQAGLRQFESGIPNSLIFFSAKYNQVALDRLPGEPPEQKNGSPFARAFVELFDEWRTRDATRYVKQVRQRLRQLVMPDPQYPWIEDGVDDQWCFAACAGEPPTVTLAAGRGPKFDKATLDVLGSVSSISSPYALYAVGRPSAPSRPAVFIGKASGSDCEKNSVSDGHPFGCELLQRVARRFAEDKSPFARFFVGAKALTQVNVRKSLPTPGVGGARYGAIIAVLKPETKVRFASFAALSYAGDTFYWGILDDSQVAAASGFR